MSWSIFPAPQPGPSENLSNKQCKTSKSLKSLTENSVSFNQWQKQRISFRLPAAKQQRSKVHCYFLEAFFDQLLYLIRPHKNILPRNIVCLVNKPSAFIIYCLARARARLHLDRRSEAWGHALRLPCHLSALLWLPAGHWNSGPLCADSDVWVI